MCPRGENGGPNSFQHVGNGAPSNKVATSLLLQKEKVFELWSMWGVGLREKMGIDQLERDRFKNAHFLSLSLNAQSSLSTPPPTCSKCKDFLLLEVE